jgi:hypothetical protein
MVALVNTSLNIFSVLYSNFIDVMTSKTSTLWLDDDQMQKMIRLIQGAKGKHSNKYASRK